MFEEQKKVWSPIMQNWSHEEPKGPQDSHLGSLSFNSKLKPTNAWGSMGTSSKPETKLNTNLWGSKSSFKTETKSNLNSWSLKSSSDKKDTHYAWNFKSSNDKKETCKLWGCKETTYKTDDNQKPKIFKSSYIAKNKNESNDKHSSFTYSSYKSSYVTKNKELNDMHCTSSSFNHKDSEVEKSVEEHYDYVKSQKVLLRDQDSAFLKAEMKQLKLQKEEEEREQHIKDLANRMESKMQEYSKIGENGDIQLLIRFPDNSKMIKRFNLTSCSNDIYHCVLSCKESWNSDSTEKKFIVRDPLGSIISENKTLKEAGITRRTVLMVEYE